MQTINAKELMEVLQAILRRPLDGVVVRRVVGDRLVARRPAPQERVDLATVFDVVALVPIEPALVRPLLVGEPSRGEAS